MTLHHGIILALQHHIQHIIIEGDNLMVISSVTRIWDPPWQINHIIQDILTLLKDVSSWEIRHIYREANRAADWIANVGHLVDTQFSVEDCNNSTIRNVLVTYKV